MKEEVRLTSKKKKFGRKATEDEESSYRSNEEVDLKTIMIGTFPVSLKCYTISLTLPYFFKSKEIEEIFVEVEKEHFLEEEKHSQRVITINPSKGSIAQKVILEKPTVEITRQIRTLYVRTHFKGKSVSKVLVNNGLAVNVMPLRMLRALGRGVGDLIETKVSILAFTREISKTLGSLLIDIIVGSKTSLSAFFVVNSTANYNALLRRDWIHDNWCVSSSLHQFLLFWKCDEVEVVWADKQPFIETSNFVEANHYDQEFSQLKFKGKKKNETPREINTKSRDIGDIQD